MDKFSELKAAAMAATPGPWILDDDSWSEGDNANVSTEERYDERIASIAQIEGGGSESGFDEPFSAEQQANARYITAANPAVVIALLAELEASNKREDGYREKWVAELSNLQDAGKRIAELEAGHQEAAKQIASWRRIAKQNIEEREKDLAALDAERQKIIGLEAKLATPVRLPDVLFIKVSGLAVPVMHAERVKEKLRAAGFTVDGDDA